MLRLADRLFLPLFLLTFVGIYTSIHIDVGFGSILAGPALVTGLLMVTLYHQEVTRRWAPLCAVLACAFLPTWLATFVQLPIASGALSFGLLTISVLIGLATYVGLLRIKRSTLMMVLALMVFTFIVAGLLENYTSFRELSDAVRHKIYANQFVYEGDARDISLYGRPRPKIFAQEPSLATRAASTMLFAYLALCWRPIEWALGGLLTLGVLYVFRSPDLIVAFALVSGIIVLRALIKQRIFGSGPINFAIIAATLAILMLSLNVTAIATLVGGERGRQIAQGAEGSTVQRILLPPQVFLQSIKTTWLGEGLGTKDTLVPVIRAALESFPDFKPAFLPDGEIVWGDGTYDLLIALGPIFASLFLFFMCRVFKTRYYFLPVLLFVLVFYLDVGAPNPRNWFYFGLVVAMYRRGLIPLPGPVALPFRSARVEPPKTVVNPSSSPPVRPQRPRFAPAIGGRRSR